MRLAIPATIVTCAALILAASQPTPASAARPVGLVSYYQSVQLPKLVHALRGTRPPRRSRIYVGNYWGSPRRRGGGPRRGPALPRPDTLLGPRYGYAPMLSIRRGTFWERRRLSQRTDTRLRRLGQARHRGRIPSLHRLRRRPPASRVAWGRELGRRFRDRIRNKRRGGTRVTTWQFDEVVSEIARDGRRRTFIRGVLQGLAYGRRSLGDRKMRGFVWIAGGARRLTRARGGGELRRFWYTIDRTALRLVGQEYPPFTGSARSAAGQHAGMQRLLRRAGGSRRALARRYIVGMSPGHRSHAGLGGNVRYASRGRINRWRRAFVRRRARMGAAGFAQFDFTSSNGRKRSMRDALRALTLGLRRVR